MTPSPDVQALIESQAKLLAKLDSFLKRDPAQEFAYNRDLAGTIKNLSSFPRYVFKTPLAGTAAAGGSVVVGLELNTHQVGINFGAINSGATSSFKTNGLFIKADLCQDPDFSRDVQTVFLTPTVQAVAVDSFNILTGDTTSFTVSSYWRHFLPVKSANFLRLAIWAITTNGKFLVFDISNLSRYSPFSVEIYGE